MSSENDITPSPPTAGINLATSFETAAGTAATLLGYQSHFLMMLLQTFTAIFK